MLVPTVDIGFHEPIELTEGKSMTADTRSRLVGSDRVLAVLSELAKRSDGSTLDELATALQSPKPTVHRALVALRRAGFAEQIGRGLYQLGDEFLRLAFTNHAARPEAVRVLPALQRLADRFGETAHYAVLEGNEVVYRAKVDPPEGAVRLTSVIGGRNPAYRTAVGKLLLSRAVSTIDELQTRLLDSDLEAHTEHSITSVSALWIELERIRTAGYAVDDQENELGINCLAVPVTAGTLGPGSGAVSVSALAFRLPLEQLVADVEAIREIVGSVLGGAQSAP